MLSYIDCIVSLRAFDHELETKVDNRQEKMRNIPKENKSITLVSRKYEDQMDRKIDRKTKRIIISLVRYEVSIYCNSLGKTAFTHWKAQFDFCFTYVNLGILRYREQSDK